MSRYLEWHRRVGTEGADPFVVDLAQNLLGYVVRFAKQNGMGAYKLQREYNGYVVEASYIGGIPKIEITPPPQTLPPALPAKGDLWIPRGFVVYPASDVAPFGWGLPIVQRTQTGDTPYSATNVAPGLDISRWTLAGPLGQVLITAVPAPLYPGMDKVVAPIMWSQTKGPAPLLHAPNKKRPDIELDQYAFQADDGVTVGAKAFRLELNPYADAAHGVGGQGTCIRIFELTNADRAAHGLDALILPIRGFYSTAQTYAATANATSWVGHYAQGFWIGYKTIADRISKDGAPSWWHPWVGVTNSLGGSVNPNEDRNYVFGAQENYTAHALSLTTVGVDPNGDAIYTAVGLTDFSPDTAFAEWMASAGHRAIIESTALNKHYSFLDVGHTSGFYSQDFTTRDQWIGSGNAAFISSAPEIPPLSWFSFMTRNLGTETLPNFWTDAGLGLPSPNPCGYISAVTSGVPFGLTATSGGTAWFNYTFGKTPPSVAGAVDPGFLPALSSSLFMRGRCIAIAPNSLVLGAGIMKLPAPLLTGQVQMYRLILLAHRETDQPADLKTNGCTSVLHVYHVDLPDVTDYAARPDSIIKGIRGMPYTTWPWTVLDDPWAWVDDGTITVSQTGESTHGPDMRAYACLWRFSPDGTQASCLRTVRSVFEDEAIANQYVPCAFGAVDLGYGGVDLTALTPPAYATYVQQLNQGYSDVRTLKLTFSSGASLNPALTVSAQCATFAPRSYPVCPQGLDATTINPAFGNNSAVEIFCRPIALDYDAHGVVQYTYSATVLNTESSFGGPASFVVVGQGDSSVIGLEDFSNIAATPIAREATYVVNLGVIDVLDGVYVIETAPSANTVYGWDVTPPICEPQGNVLFTWNVLYQSEAFYSVAVYRKGVLLNQQSYANTDGLYSNNPVLATYSACGSGSVRSYFYYNSTDVDISSAMVQASYAKNRNGDWVFTYQLSPQPGLIRSNNGTPLNGTATDYCGHPLAGAPSIVDFYGVTGCAGPTAHYMTRDELNPRGGWMTSSFANTSALATMTGTPGSNARFLYARTV